MDSVDITICAIIAVIIIIGGGVVLRSLEIATEKEKNTVYTTQELLKQNVYCESRWKYRLTDCNNGFSYSNVQNIIEMPKSTQ